MFAAVERFEIIPEIARVMEPNSCELSTNKKEEALSMKEEAERIGMPEHWRPPKIDGNWKNKSFISAEQLTAEDIADIVNMAARIRDTRISKNQRQFFELSSWLFPHSLQTAFYEPSTRTRISFEEAALILGLRVISSPDMVKMSSFSKGETVADNAIVMGEISPVIVQRHPEVGAAAIAAFALQLVTRCDGTKPRAINAGDGIGEHPTQALLDITTIIWEKRLKNARDLQKLHIGILGDLKHGRTVHSLTKTLSCLGGPDTFYFISPEQLAMPQTIIDTLLRHGQKVVVVNDLLEVLPKLDVLYVTRVQNERFEDPNDYLRYESLYRVTPEIMERAKEDLTLMHPLPRRNEIAAVLDRDPRAAYFRQVENGVDVRMALLCCMFDRPYPNLRGRF